MPARLRADLRVATKDRRTVEAEVIRTLVAAIDNAEAACIRAALANHHATMHQCMPGRLS